MSGVEILGLAASVIQIAELGAKLSVSLFTFTRKVKNANKTIDALSQEIAVTGAVLQQLGETLSNDKSVKVCSQEAIDTAKKLVLDTEKVFKNLENLLDVQEKPNSRFRKAVNLKRLKFPFLESEIEQVQANLERLKSSLLVILNVLIFAEQLRKYAFSSSMDGPTSICGSDVVPDIACISPSVLHLVVEHVKVLTEPLVVKPCLFSKTNEVSSEP